MLSSLSMNLSRRFGFGIPQSKDKLAGQNNNNTIVKDDKLSCDNNRKELSMDGNSVITQVSKEDSLNITNGHISKSQEIKSKNRNNKRKSFLHSLRCCFGNPRQTQHPEKEKAQIQINTESKENSIKQSTPAESPCTTPNGERNFLLPKLQDNHKKKKCAIIDLDETLVHSSFKPISNADFIVPVEIDGTVHQVYVLKRPHVDTFLKRMGEMYECVLFTASLSKYADPVADLLDLHNTFSCRLFRDSCVFHKGNYVKDLSLLGREMNQIIIIDNSPASYIFHPDNAVPVLSWFDDESDIELVNLIPYLEAIAESDDVYSVLSKSGFNMQAAQAMQQLQQQIPMSVAYRPQVIMQAAQSTTDEEDDDNSSTHSHNEQQQR